MRSSLASALGRGRWSAGSGAGSPREADVIVGTCHPGEAAGVLSGGAEAAKGLV